jgi:hypothetical protein
VSCTALPVGGWWLPDLFRDRDDDRDSWETPNRFASTGRVRVIAKARIVGLLRTTKADKARRDPKCAASAHHAR